MRIALYSDLHLELLREAWQPPETTADIVILAGDIGKHTHGLKWAAQAFQRKDGTRPHVVYVAGNHEYYDAHLGLLHEMQKPIWQENGVEFLEKRTLELPGVRILGCTLWSGFTLFGTERAEIYMRHAKHSVNDYWLIHARQGKRLEPMDTWRMHRTAVDWLDLELAKPFEGATVVVTHFAPHRKCVAPQHENSYLSPYFNTDLAWLMKKHRIDLWCHGHTHTNNDFVAENECRVVSNQRGYPFEVASGGFREDLVIPLDMLRWARDEDVAEDRRDPQVQARHEGVFGEQPGWMCLPCGDKFRRAAWRQSFSCHYGHCDVCGRDNVEVTTPDNCGYLKAWENG